MTSGASLHAGTLPLGRFLYATAMLGFGILCLAYVDSVHQLQPIVEFVPTPNGATRALAIFTGVLLVGSGVALVTGVKAHWFTTALVIYFAAWIAFLHVPSAFLNPRLLRSPFWVRTFETLALSGGALVLAGLTSTPARERWIQTGRILFGVSLPVFGVLHVVYAGNVASLVPGWYPWPFFWAYLTASGNVAAGVALVTGRFARGAALLTGFMYGMYVLTLHIPRVVTIHRAQLAAGDPAALQLARGGMTSLCVAIAMSATAWIVAGSLMRSSENALSDASSGSDARTREPSEPAVGQGVS